MSVLLLASYPLSSAYCHRYIMGRLCHIGNHEHDEDGAVIRGYKWERQSQSGV
jgi:hypothetical protein